MQQLAPLLGEIRWEEFLGPGCRTGRELVGQQEARQSCMHLQEDLEGLLALQVQGAGDECMTGAIRKLITILEDDRLKVLERALELHPDQSARPVLAHTQLDKLCQG